MYLSERIEKGVRARPQSHYNSHTLSPPSIEVFAELDGANKCGCRIGQIHRDVLGCYYGSALIKQSDAIPLLDLDALDVPAGLIKTLDAQGILD